MNTKINIEDRLLSQDRWIIGMIMLGLFSFWVLIAEAAAIDKAIETEQEQASEKITTNLTPFFNTRTATGEQC